MHHHQFFLNIYIYIYIYPWIYHIIHISGTISLLWMWQIFCTQIISFVNSCIFWWKRCDTEYNICDIVRYVYIYIYMYEQLSPYHGWEGVPRVVKTRMLNPYTIILTDKTPTAQVDVCDTLLPFAQSSPEDAHSIREFHFSWLLRRCTRNR